ncbi:WbqC family protein [Rheinheimera riviphila]|uniref:WbqC family protein n=1 Tax=Rheinheimera riviphila TaxID=1834037 RepID=UPI0023EA6509|nr:WbqC family protein [Rheinheimera riviphila]
MAAFQPYLFPYIGYFKLISEVDIFVVLDDVSFRKKSYINRNTIKICGKPHNFTVPVKDVSQNRLINQHYYMNDGDLFVKMIGDYGRTAIFGHLKEYYEYVFSENNISGNVAEVNFLLISKVCEMLQVKTKIIKSSSLLIDAVGERRIIDICTSLGASCYVNPVGGIGLYGEETFLQAGLDLEFKDYRGLIAGDVAYSILDDIFSKGVCNVSNILRSTL